MIDLKKTVIELITLVPQSSNNNFMKIEYHSHDSIWLWLHLNKKANYLIIIASLLI